MKQYKIYVTELRHTEYLVMGNNLKDAIQNFSERDASGNRIFAEFLRDVEPPTVRLRSVTSLIDVSKERALRDEAKYSYYPKIDDRDVWIMNESAINSILDSK